MTKRSLVLVLQAHDSRWGCDSLRSSLVGQVCLLAGPGGLAGTHQQVRAVQDASFRWKLWVFFLKFNTQRVLFFVFLQKNVSHHGVCSLLSERSSGILLMHQTNTIFRGARHNLPVKTRQTVADERIRTL